MPTVDGAGRGGGDGTSPPVSLLIVVLPDGLPAAASRDADSRSDVSPASGGTGFSLRLVRSPAFRFFNGDGSDDRTLLRFPRSF